MPSTTPILSLRLLQRANNGIITLCNRHHIPATLALQISRRLIKTDAGFGHRMIKTGNDPSGPGGPKNIKTGDPKKGGGGKWGHGDWGKPENRGIDTHYPPADPHKGGDGDIYLHPQSVHRPAGQKTVEDFAKPDRNKYWVSLGYDFQSQEEDRFKMHWTSFCYITLVVCGTSWIWYYNPDHKFYDWAYREAFIELARRKALDPHGPVITRDYVDPKKIKLPTEEELKDVPIII